MFYSMYGKVVNKFDFSIVLEVNNICYLIYVDNNDIYEINESYELFLYSYVKEYETLLYGFDSLEKKELFVKLLGVKGVGPKTILKMFSISSAEEIEKAIVNGDEKFLIKFPKIGDKVAKQILFDLKKKVNRVVIGNNYDELISILKGLGYKEKEYRNILFTIDTKLNIDDQLKEALKLLSK